MNLDKCPVCGITWKEELEIPDSLMQKMPEHYRTRKQAKAAARHYGWTKANKRKFSVNMIGIEYSEVYDGVAEWRCESCEARFDRVTGKRIFSTNDLTVFK